MKGMIGFALASGLAFLVAGCAPSGGGSTGGAPAGGGGGESSAAAAGGAQTASAGQSVRDFNLQVKCPGIHLEKTKLKWSDDKIMEHENVSAEEIASCEAFTASQPKGYVPPPPAGVAAAMVGNATGPGPGGQPYSGPNSAGPGSTGASQGNQPQGNH